MAKKPFKSGGKLPPIRIPTPGPTVWHKDKSKYSRKKKHKKEENEE
jgi:hypothetical protein